jgi:hypothetical protein
MPLHLGSVEPEQATEEVTQARHQPIEQAAYSRAEERAFAPGGEIDDWLRAEADFDSAKAVTLMA